MNDFVIKLFKKLFLLFLLNLLKDEFIFSILKSFFVWKTSSTNETLGVGTLIAIPSNFPLREGIISPIALEAPVEVGTIDWPADLAHLGSLWELSSILWSYV